MSALSKLVVGKDAGTSRPATAQHTSRPTTAKQQQQQQQVQAHPILQSLGFQTPPGVPCPPGWSSAAQACVPSPDASGKQHSTGSTAPHKATTWHPQHQRQQHQQQQQQQQLSSTLSQVLAAAPAQAAPVKPHPPAQSSRPVTPHATKPYRAMPAVSTILKQGNTTNSSSNRPASASGHLLTPLTGRAAFGGSTNVTGQFSSSGDGRAGWLGSRPGTASCLYCYQAAGGAGLQQGHRGAATATATATAAGTPRPGSAAAAKILRAIDKACVATPSTAAVRAAAQRRPAPYSVNHDSAQQADSSPQRHGQQQHEQQMVLHGLQQSIEPTAAAVGPDELSDMPSAQNSSSPCLAPAHPTAAAAAAAADIRPSAAAVRSVLATAAAPDDGVDAQLTAIHEKNSTFDRSADLDIVYEDDEAAVAEAAAADEELCSLLGGLGPILAGAVDHVGGAGVFKEDAAAAAAAAAVGSVSALGQQSGQQATAMVLNLDDLTQCTPEVLEIELDSLDFDQLTMLKQVLDA